MRLFGTDGVRGLANRDLTAPFAMGLAAAAVEVLADDCVGDERPHVVVGRDPRASGEFLSAAVVAGIAGAGADVRDVGVLPTPAVAFLTDITGADFGVVLSASHNPMPDNGVKFFARGGKKLPDHVEDDIEAAYLRGTRAGPVGRGVGRVTGPGRAAEQYIEHLATAVGGSLQGLRVVVDAANGAASRVSPEAMRRLGADVIGIHGDPDGYNINDGCGSTHLSDLKAAVREHRADAGIAHDGDADRCLAIDERGGEIDGDQIMAILARDMKSHGRLAGDTVVATVMSNLGFRLAMRDAGIEVLATAVGDRYVLEAMLEGGFNLGGEQSGHVLLLDEATTGDGSLTALTLLRILAESSSTLSELAAVMRRLPQVLINVPDVDKSRMEEPQLVEAVRAAERDLGDTGRVLLRPSGTEPLVRVMVEAADESQAQRIAGSLADTVADLLR